MVTCLTHSNRPLKSRVFCFQEENGAFDSSQEDDENEAGELKRQDSSKPGSQNQPDPSEKTKVSPLLKIGHPVQLGALTMDFLPFQKRKNAKSSATEPKAKQTKLKAPKTTTPKSKSKKTPESEAANQPSYQMTTNQYGGQFNSSGNSAQLEYLRQEPSMASEKSMPTTILIRDEDTDQIQKLTFPAALTGTKASSSQTASRSSHLLSSLPPATVTILNPFSTHFQ